MTSWSADVFVGRGTELQELRAALTASQAGRGRICLLTGEAGIGKTRLAEALATQASASGARVLWGRAWDGGGAPAYWPWMQIIRRLEETPEGAEVWRNLGAGALRLAPLAAERGPSTGLPAPDIAESEAARFALFDALAGLLRHAGHRRPLMLVLDDLHATDISTLLLLEAAAHTLDGASVLVVGTSREPSAEHDAGRSVVLSRVARLALHLPLGGWSAADVTSFIASAVGHSPAPRVADAVHDVTKGNPFYVVEIVRQLAAQHGGVLPDDIAGGTPMPASVRLSIREHLRPLPGECRRLLQTAAVIGRAFDLALLSEASGVPVAAVLAGLAPAIAAGTVLELRGAPTAWSFRHDLIRAALYDDLPAAERPRLHGYVGTALARRHGWQAGVHLAEIAHHLSRAESDLELALAYVEGAAHAAAARLAFEDAAARYEEALELLRRVRPADAGARAELLLALGKVRGCIASAGGRQAFQDAAAVARDAGDVGRLARAALGFADRGLGVPHHAPDPDAVALLEEALALVPDREAALRARLVARLSAEMAVSDDRRRGESMSETAVALARRADDRAALAHALSARHFVLWRWDAPADRAAIAIEMVRLAAELGDADLEMQGRTWLTLDLIRAGDAAELDAQIERYAHLADQLRHPRWLWMAVNLRAVRALWRGDFAAAEGFIDAALAASARVDDAMARFNPLVQRFALRREQGRLEEEEVLVRLAAQRTPGSPAPATFLALLLCELGHLDEARHVFDAVAREDFDDLERDRRLGVLPYLAEVCTALGDAPRAARLYALLLPHAEINVPYAASLCFGCGAHYLAQLAAVRADAGLAAGHFETALVMHARMDAAPWLARTQLAYAELLRARGEDRGRADDLRRAAEATARALGMPTVLARAMALGQRSETRASGTVERTVGLVAAPARPIVQRAIFRRAGGHWEVGDGHTLLRFKDSKGLRYLCYLLHRPGREIHVSELVDARQGAAAAPDPITQRLEALRDSLEEATRFNDIERATRARAEIELLAERLASRVGLAGAGRATAASAQHARLNVSRTIADAIKRIAAQNPTLGRYFATTISTGAFCSFTPDPRLPIDWSLSDDTPP